MRATPVKGGDVAIDHVLRDDVRAHLQGPAGVAEVVEKSMFGGAGFMWRGNLLCGVMGDELLVRVAKDDSDSWFGEDGAHPMVMGGRTSQGWILVPIPATERAALLAKWVGRAKAYVETLPAK
jgi:TfoX/Sxy family transcriptional regulator of competence genes